MALSPRLPTQGTALHPPDKSRGLSRSVSVMQTTSKQEIDTVEEAWSISRQFSPHLDRALDLLTNKKSPDYANSIKKSISAVEAICTLIVDEPKMTLGKALGRLESKQVILHDDLKEAFKKLYGYTSDNQGIRHGFIGKPNLRC